MVKRALHPASVHSANETVGDMLLLFGVGLDMAAYEAGPLPAEVLHIIIHLVLGPLDLVRAGHSYLYDTNGSVNPKWLLRFMSIARKEHDIPYGAAYYKKRAKRYVGAAPLDRLWAGFDERNEPPHPEWTRKQWERFLHWRFERHVTRRDHAIFEHGCRPFLYRNIYDHGTRFYVAGLGASFRHQVMLYEPYSRPLLDEAEEATISEQLREVLGGPNFDRFVRVRDVSGVLQIFFFGSAVDIDTVMESNLFRKHAYSAGADALHCWPTPGCEWGYGPAVLTGKEGRRPLRIAFK